MKKVIVVAAIAVLTPLTAYAQERMSDAQYLAANRCLAYADLEQLQADRANVASLREAVEVGRRDPAVNAQVRQTARGIRARASTLNADELRSRRNEACAGFVQSGLVQLGGSSAS